MFHFNWSLPCQYSECQPLSCIFSGAGSGAVLAVPGGQGISRNGRDDPFFPSWCYESNVERGGMCLWLTWVRLRKLKSCSLPKQISSPVGKRCAELSFRPPWEWGRSINQNPTSVSLGIAFLVKPTKPNRKSKLPFTLQLHFLHFNFLSGYWASSPFLCISPPFSNLFLSTHLRIFFHCLCIRAPFSFYLFT